MENNVLKCTRCGKPFDQFRFHVSLSVNTEQMMRNSVKQIANAEFMTNEYICETCFEAFKNALGTLNKEN
jgi:DNA-directed RNA polymerase subunit RPC12/RpoP